MTGEEASTPEVITGRRRPVSRREQVILAISMLALVALIVLDIRRFNWPNLIVVFAMLALTGYRLGRPATVVDSSGINRPWQRPGFVSWNDVDCVVAPQPGVLTVGVQLVSGKTIHLQDIDVTSSPAVAALGGKPLLKAYPAGFPRAGRPGVPRPDSQFDIDQRIARLAAQRAALDAEARRLGNQSPPPAG